ncbi:MAG: hypothetical protein HXS54_04805 [Theionarchaea archaeon]|nr:hypothetical protein [Theionarchaea archaeon]
MEVEMYVLGLPNFRDDSVVFGTDELKSIKKEISRYLRRKGLLEKESEAPGGWHVFKLNPERLYTEKPDKPDKLGGSYIKESSNYTIHSAELGYYHHRVIMHLKLGLVDFYISKKNKIKLGRLIYDMIANSKNYTQEEIEKRLKKLIRNIINECMEAKNDELSSFEENKGDKILGDYIRKKVRNELKKLVNDIINGYIGKKINKFEFLEKNIEIKRKVKSCIWEESKELKDPRTVFKNIDEIEELKSDLAEVEELKSDLAEVEELKIELVELIDNAIDEQLEELEELEELIDNIINELKEKKANKLEFAKRNKIKEEIKSSVQMRLKESEELKNELRNTNKLEYLKKSEELIDTIVDELLEKKTDKLKSAIGDEIKEKTKTCIQTKLDNHINELNGELEKFCRFMEELRRLIILKNRLRESIDDIIQGYEENYKERQKIRFYFLERVRNNKKKLVDNTIDKYVKENMDKLSSFEIIGIGEKVGLYVIERARKVSKKLIDYEIDFFKIIKLLKSGTIDICKTIRNPLDTVNMWLEIELGEILSKDIEEKDKFLALRDARKELGKGTRNIINDCVIESVNELIRSGKVTEKGRIEFIYTYPLIVVKSSAEKHEPVPFSEETTSLCFEIVEPKWWLPLGRKHMMRISIPSTILYVQKGVGKDLLRDIINAIYQYCLYEKKAKDEKKRLIDWKNGPYDNQLDEDILTKLWEHVLHAMGGRSADLRVVRITNMTRLIALLAFLVSASSLILTLILRYLSQLGN